MALDRDREDGSRRVLIPPRQALSPQASELHKVARDAVGTLEGNARDLARSTRGSLETAKGPPGARIAADSDTANSRRLKRLHAYQQSPPKIDVAALRDRVRARLLLYELYAALSPGAAVGPGTCSRWWVWVAGAALGRRCRRDDGVRRNHRRRRVGRPYGDRCSAWEEGEGTGDP